MKVAVYTLVVIYAVAVAQQSPRRSNESPVDATQSLFGIAYVIPAAESSDSSWWMVGYQIVAGRLLFTERNYSRTEYVARYTATVELRDTLGVVRYAHVFRDSVVTTVKPSYTSDLRVANFERVLLANGTYTVVVDVVQQQRQRMFWQTTIVASHDARSVASQSLVFLDEQVESSHRCLRQWGTNVPFGTRYGLGALLVPRSWSGRDRLRATYRLVKQYYPFYSGSDTVATIGVIIDSTVRFAYPRCQIEPNDRGNRVCCNLKTSDRFRFVAFEMDFRRAIPGEYVLMLTRPATGDTLVVPFRVQWFSAPPHLFVSRYAVEVMRYVLTDDEYHKLLDQPDNLRTAAILQWWKRFDPTPATAYNEAMVEYFQRAFDARTLFATAQESDGALTERGKVYVLFGKPTRVETNLGPDGPRNEIWYYTNTVRKRFTFEITEQGKYRLVQMDSL